MNTTDSPTNLAELETFMAEPRQRAILILTDQPDGKVGLEVTYFPPAPTLSGEIASGAIRTAELLKKLMGLANLHDNRAPLFTRGAPALTPPLFAAPVAGPERAAMQGEARTALATLIGFAWRIGKIEKLDRFLAELRRAGTVPDTEPELWSAEILREVLSRFQQQEHINQQPQKNP